jgi:hypothetical protein
MNQRALQMIEDALLPLIRRGRRIERIKLIVCPDSEIALHKVVNTRFGQVQVKTDDFVYRGLAYLMEDPGLPGRGFSWVSRPPEHKVSK